MYFEWQCKSAPCWACATAGRSTAERTAAGCPAALSRAQLHPHHAQATVSKFPAIFRWWGSLLVISKLAPMLAHTDTAIAFEGAGRCWSATAYQALLDLLECAPCAPAHRRLLLPCCGCDVLCKHNVRQLRLMQAQADARPDFFGWLCCYKSAEQMSTLQRAFGVVIGVERRTACNGQLCSEADGSDFQGFPPSTCTSARARSWPRGSLSLHNESKRTMLTRLALEH